jgi:outer membrane protein assembly factor BamB
MRILSMLLFVGCLPSLAQAENWPRFRGAAGIGVTAEKDLPRTWNGKTGENVLWKAPLKGTTGYSSPIVWGERVFLTMADKQTRQQEEAKEVPPHYVACFRVSDGEMLWKTSIEPGKEVAGYSIYASPTPVTDGKTVFAWFGSGVIAALDYEGKILWRQERPGPFNLNPGICSSPTLYGDTVLLICDQNRNLGWLQALDKRTGEIQWEQKRPKTGACNTTPFLLDVQGKTQLIVAGEKILEGLRPDTGEPIWWCKSNSFGASPAYGSGLIFVDKGANESARAVDPTGTGDVTETHVKWTIDKYPGDYSSPVISGKHIYRVQSDGVLSVYNLTDGDKLYSGRLEGFPKIASPIATPDGYVYCVSTGKSYVLKDGPKLEIIATNDLGGGGNCSSPAIANGKIYIRDFDHLYCIGAK